jgi:hypothetical protein
VSANPFKRTIRQAGAFLSHLFVAVIGTAVAEDALRSHFRYNSLRQSLLTSDAINALTAFALGYAACRFASYRKWPANTSKWVWVAGLCWFGQRVVFAPNEHHIPVWEISATSSVLPDYGDLSNWAGYTVPFLRTVFYSAGARWSSDRTGTVTDNTSGHTG